MSSAVMLWSMSELLFNASSVLLHISQSSCSWLEVLQSCSEALDPQTPSLLLDFHRGLPGRDKLAARSDVTLPRLRSWCDYHPRNHCQTVETKLPCMFPRLLPASSSSLRECSCWARFTLLWYHAQWSQTNHSHFPGSFPRCVSHSFSRRGIVSVAKSES